MFQKHLSTPLGTKIAEHPGNENEGKVMKLQTQELRNMVGEMHRAEQFFQCFLPRNATPLSVTKAISTKEIARVFLAGPRYGLSWVPDGNSGEIVKVKLSVGATFEILAVTCSVAISCNQCTLARWRTRNEPTSRARHRRKLQR